MNPVSMFCFYVLFLHVPKQLSIDGTDLFYQEGASVHKNNSAVIFVYFFHSAGNGCVGSAVLFAIRLKIGKFDFGILRDIFLDKMKLGVEPFFLVLVKLCKRLSQMRRFPYCGIVSGKGGKWRELRGIVEVKVMGVDLQKKRIQLTMKL